MVVQMITELGSFIVHLLKFQFVAFWNSPKLIKIKSRPHLRKTNIDFIINLQVIALQLLILKWPVENF